MPKRFTTMGIPGMGIGVFFVQYHAFDMGERRARFNAVLQARSGGPLGLQRIREIRIPVLTDSPARVLWDSLFHPSEDGVWTPAAGPAVRLLSGVGGSQRVLVVEVSRLGDAERALAERGITYTRGADRIVIDPRRLFGLALELREAPSVRQPGSW